MSCFGNHLRISSLDQGVGIIIILVTGAVIHRAMNSIQSAAACSPRYSATPSGLGFMPASPGFQPAGHTSP